jgi:hypothetical protein
VDQAARVHAAIEPQSLTPRLRLASDPAEPIVVGPSLGYFQRGPLPRFDLVRRESLRLLMQALTEKRIHEPGVGLTQEALFEVGWPGQKIRSRSAAARVYTAVNTLRRAGLDGALVRRGHEYLLDPVVPVVRIEG